MIHLKYKVNFVKLPLIWNDLCLKLVFENATAGRNTSYRSVVYIDMRSIIRIMGKYLDSMKSFVGYESVL